MTSTEPVRVTIERAREILASDPDPEKRGLAQHYIDLTTANGLLSACLDDEPGDPGSQTRALRDHFFHGSAR